MILEFLLYSSTVSLALTIGALAMELIVARIGWPRRGLWAVTLLFSIVLPIIMLAIPHSSEAMVPGKGVDTFALPIGIEKEEPTFAPAPPVANPVVTRPTAAYALPALDGVVEGIWLAVSAGVAGAWVLSWIRLLRTRNQWRRETVDGRELWVTPALGPAVLGFFRPQVLMPQWLMDAPATTRSVVLRHELEHISSRDPLWLLVGFVAVLLAPWNLPLWWQLRRLRFAVEVDCDARVLRTGTPLPRYGDILITVSQRSVMAPLGALAIAKPRSELERRIRIMVFRGSRPARWLLGAYLAIATACGAFALDLPTPTLPNSPLSIPPLRDWSPYLPKAEAAARAVYPELFQGRFSGTVVLLVNLKRDGAVLDTHKREFPPGLLADDAVEFDSEIISDLDRMPGTANRKFFGWSGPEHRNGLYMYYQVLKWPHDPTRSAARVRAAVAKQYPEFFRSYPPKPASEEPTTKSLTVFMNDDGTINRGRLREEGSDSYTSTERMKYDRFLALGLKPEQFGHRSRTINVQDSHHLLRYPNAPLLNIDYAWPHRPDDPPDVIFQSRPTFNQTFDKQQQEIEGRVSDSVVLQRYFPDIWVHGAAAPTDAFWILTDVNGVVCDSGRNQTGAGFKEIENEIMTRYPGTRIALEVGKGPKTANGRGVSLDYIRLAEDSPLTSCQAIRNVRKAQH